MKYCSQCGKQLENSARFCTFCGAQTELFPQNAQRVEKSSRVERLRSFFGRYFTVSDTTSAYKPNDTAENRSTALLSYLHVLVFVPMLAMKESRFTQYHVRVGLNLLIYQLAAEILGWLLLHTLGWIPVLGVLLYLLVFAVNAGLWAIAIFGIVSAARGRARELVNFENFKLFR